MARGAPWRNKDADAGAEHGFTYSPWRLSWQHVGGWGTRGGRGGRGRDGTRPSSGTTFAANATTGSTNIEDIPAAPSVA
eukprot:1215269-Pyramimonas_sp.AAC.1